MTTERDYRRALYMVAPSHQGGHSAAGAEIAGCLGLKFPITMPDLEMHARLDGYSPEAMWPWYYKMRREEKRA